MLTAWPIRPDIRIHQGTLMSTSLLIEDLTVGDGAEAVTGKEVTVHYTGWLTDGQKFDSSKDRMQPFSFPLGAGHVIRAGIRRGRHESGRQAQADHPAGAGLRRARGAGGVIPPNATLVFEVELLSID